MINLVGKISKSDNWFCRYCPSDVFPSIRMGQLGCHIYGFSWNL